MNEDRVVIASYFWKDCEEKLPYRPLGRTTGGFVHDFICPKGTVGKKDGKPRPGLLVVETMNEGLGIIDGHTMVKPVKARDIAMDLVRKWSSGGEFGEKIGPAVFICAGDAPTPEESRAAIRKQDAWAGVGVNQAQNLWITGNRDKVHGLHRECAEYMGRGDFEWVRPQAAVSLTACPYCQKQIPNTASVCSHCGRTANPVLLAKTEKALEANLLEFEKLTQEVRDIDPEITITAPAELAASEEFAIPEGVG